MGKGFFVCFGGKRSKSKNLASSKEEEISSSTPENYNNNEKQQQQFQLHSKLPKQNGLVHKDSVKTVKRNSQQQREYVTTIKKQGENETVKVPVPSAATNTIIEDIYISKCKPDWEKLEVIPLLLQHLQVPDLINCRLVCKSWKNEASRLLRLNEDFCQKIPITKLREYTQTMAISPDNPMQSYQFHITNMRHPDIRHFFGQLGHTIVSLVLNLLISEAEAFFNILPWMPNLRELMLFLIPNENSGYSGATKGSKEKPELIIRLVDPDIITYLENVKALIYCNYELKICPKEVTAAADADCKLFSLTSRGGSILQEDAIVEEDEDDDEVKERL